MVQSADDKMPRWHRVGRGIMCVLWLVLKGAVCRFSDAPRCNWGRGVVLGLLTDIFVIGALPLRPLQLDGDPVG